jgi:hypothetical protein
MGNCIKAKTVTLVKSLPSCLEWTNDIREDVLPSGKVWKQSEIIAKLHPAIDGVHISLDLLVPHEHWVNGEDIYNREKAVNFLHNYYGFSRPQVEQANFIVEASMCSKSYERKDDFFKFIEELKPHLIDNHPNILGECKDEDGHDKNNFTIYLREDEYKAFIEDCLDFCDRCPLYHEHKICKDVEKCRRAYNLGWNQSRSAI